MQIKNNKQTKKASKKKTKYRICGEKIKESIKLYWFDSIIIQINIYIIQYGYYY